MANITLFLLNISQIRTYCPHRPRIFSSSGLCVRLLTFVPFLSYGFSLHCTEMLFVFHTRVQHASVTAAFRRMTPGYGTGLNKYSEKPIPSVRGPDISLQINSVTISTGIPSHITDILARNEDRQDPDRCPGFKTIQTVVAGTHYQFRKCSIWVVEIHSFPHQVDTPLLPARSLFSRDKRKNRLGQTPIYPPI